MDIGHVVLVRQKATSGVKDIVPHPNLTLHF